MSSTNHRLSEEPLAILIVDDDGDTRQIYAEYLRQQGCNVFTAPDGRAGLDKIDALKPDVIVLDLAMPRVDGWTVLKHVRGSSFTAQIAVIVVSAVSDARDAAIYAGCDAYLMKPCLPDVLALQIRALSRFQSTTRMPRSFL